MLNFRRPPYIVYVYTYFGKNLRIGGRLFTRRVNHMGDSCPFFLKAYPLSESHFDPMQ